MRNYSAVCDLCWGHLHAKGYDQPVEITMGMFGEQCVLCGEATHLGEGHWLTRKEWHKYRMNATAEATCR